MSRASASIVHEWSDHELVCRIGEHRARQGGYRLLFHDTHHRAITQPCEMRRYDLSRFDGVLAYGRVLRDLYLKNGWARRTWVWHEAADTRLFRPIAADSRDGDLLWIGNWGDDERTAELHEYLLAPVIELPSARARRPGATVAAVEFSDSARFPRAKFQRISAS